MKVQEVRSGYGNVVCGVEPDIDILLITAAFYYGQGPSKTWRRPTMYLHIPENQSRSEPEEVTNTVAPSLQYALDEAITLHG